MVRELSRRPGLLFCLALAGGLTTFDGWIGAAIGLGAVFVGAGLGWRLGLAAAFLAGLWLAPAPAPRLPDARPFRGEAVVLSIPRLTARGQSCEIESGGARYLLLAPAEPALSAGDQVQVTGDSKPLSSGLRQLGALRRIQGEVKVEAGGVKRLGFGWAPFRWGVEWRRSFAAYADASMPKEAAAATKALCFNIDADLSEATYENLQRTGTVHIISASGLHVLILAMGLRFLIGFLPIPRGYQLGLIGALLLVYAAGAGLRPPVVRSVAMAGILGSATLFRREPDLLSALGAAAAGYLLWRPVSVYDVGFQLSFAAVAGLACFIGLPSDQPSSAWRRVLSDLVAVSRASLVATLATAPLTAYYFGTVSIVSVPANVLIALALPPLTLTAFAAHALSFWVPSLSAGLTAGVVQPLAGWVLAVVDFLGPQSFAAIEVPSFSAYWMLPYYALMLLFWRPRARPV